MDLGWQDGRQVAQLSATSGLERAPSGALFNFCPDCPPCVILLGNRWAAMATLSQSAPPLGGSQTHWAMVIFDFLALAVSSSGRATLRFLMPIWQAEFGWSSSHISGVGAAALVVPAAIAPIAGRLVDRMGPRFTLNLGMGLLGIGCALVATAVTRSFCGQRGLATGIATSGSTAGQFLIVP